MADERPLATWIVREDEDGVPLERFLRERVPSEPAERVRAAIASRVTLSWAAEANPRAAVLAGGRVRLFSESLDEIPDRRPIPVVAEGSDFLAVDKPAGVPVHPSRSVRINSVIERVRRARREPELRLAHRLDRETSGVLLLARSRDAAASLGRAFERGAVAKEYVAVVRGTPSTDAGVVDLAIGRAAGSEVKVRQAVGHGQSARTHWFVERRGPDRSLLRLVPVSGRRHQLRVHLEAIGHPIVGDMLYGRPDRDYLDLVAGTRDARTETLEPLRMLLHSRSLRFPLSGSDVEVVIEPPEEFVAQVDARDRRSGNGGFEPAPPDKNGPRGSKISFSE